MFWNLEIFGILSEKPKKVGKLIRPLLFILFYFILFTLFGLR